MLLEVGGLVVGAAELREAKALEAASEESRTIRVAEDLLQGPTKIVEDSPGSVKRTKPPSPEEPFYGSETGGSSSERPKAPLKPPADRHYVNRVKQKSLPREKNSVAEPWVDVKADVEQINTGQAVKKGEKFIVNGRTYGQHDGTLYPELGPGIHPLDRNAFKALGVYNKFGNTPEAEGILNKVHGMTYNQKSSALAAWESGKGLK